MKLIFANTLQSLFSQLGWDTETGPQRLAQLLFDCLSSTGYSELGYGTIEEIIKNDIEPLQALSLHPKSGLLLYACIENEKILALAYAYSFSEAPSALRVSILPYADLALLGPQMVELLHKKEGPEIVYADWLLVHPSARRKGLGRQLFFTVLDTARKNGAKYWLGKTLLPQNENILNKIYIGEAGAKIFARWKEKGHSRVAFLGPLKA
jgi:GNAT superfamily N-acetyltransferase